MVKVGQLNSKDFPANKKYAIPLSIWVLPTIR